MKRQYLKCKKKLSRHFLQNKKKTIDKPTDISAINNNKRKNLSSSTAKKHKPKTDIAFDQNQKQNSTAWTKPKMLFCLNTLT